ncbi:hypothetical protein IFM89_028971 [Coptis chinensis]|uniref:Uncharacterized protein n=1 Tax=Coptis chinensis TaxID=261450 RepID=A0A835M242_9MAGN|nr:hypothetical protein IFM89_028971 [Coptis chinensis]
MAPPAMNTMEQLLKLQNAISQLEELVQDGNVVLLKLQALSLSVFLKVAIALVLAFLPCKYIILLTFLDTFTRYSPPRIASTEKWNRRLREWWFSIPAAPVLLERPLEQKKKK